MVEEELAALARRHGVATRYSDWRGRETGVSPDTLRSVLAALGADVSSPAAVLAELERERELDRTRLLPPVVVVRRGEDPPRPPGDPELTVEFADGTVRPFGGASFEGGSFEGGAGDVPLGWHRLHARSGDRQESVPLLVAPRALAPPERAWGFTVQLYSVLSSASWGIGDLHDLADLAAWSARDLGAGFTLINPLHATEAVPPIGPSPYSPMSRRFAAPLYLRVEDLPEFAALPAADRDRLGALGAPLRPDGGGAPGTIDRGAAWAAKLRALESLHRLPRGDAEQREFAEFRAREGGALTMFATWSALSEKHGPDWRTWPAELRAAGNRAVAGEAARLADRVDFHAWLQWRLDGQLAAAQRAARDAGMPIGIVHDLAVGVAHGSADAWMYRDMIAPGMSVGAPPDEFNQRGQDWGQPPWHPRRLAEAAYAPFRDMLAAAFRHGGGLRLDHAMQVSRLWWVPEGGSPADGTYVRYDRDALLGCLAWEAERAGAVVVGEDLGTVEPEVRDALAAHGVLGTSLLWFERDGGGRPKRAPVWREPSLATVGTHDMPPVTGFLHGDHIDLRDRLGLLTRPRSDEEDDHRRRLADWLGLLHAEGLLAAPPDTVLRALADGSGEHDGDVVAALHAFLARTPARLLGVALADAVGERRTQNQPGTVDEYPNWRVPLAGPDGRPVLLDDLPSRPLPSVDPVRAGADAVGRVSREST
ncbi:4-alpha-glucanotransferase [Actinomadura sp. WMMB 499]|uniref:4-alpha-glucanotransferase n=1 Tax=Actinomadura sp. WMMB 499 TaxID=1219491 RepID=UPI001244679C|nr:4-alpha-glucanotransferase [Actinomadura sp. WMMB 499]QFG21185.1 4-alpha-glucanotransferase [Actinomadura sp. WMMB 499]